MSQRLTPWFVHWLDAAMLQADRVVHVGDDDHSRRITEAIMFVMAVRDALRSATAILGEDHPALERLDRTVPGLKDTRDILEHHDEYAVGTGRKQKGALTGSQLLLGISGASGLDSADHALSLTLVHGRSTTEGDTLAMDPKTYEVSLADALAGLVPIADEIAAQAGVDPDEHPIIRRLKTMLADDGQIARRHQ